MKKIIYWYGVYCLCVAINGILRRIREESERSYRKWNNNRTNETAEKESRHTDDTDRKPMNKIGFQISAE